MPKRKHIKTLPLFVDADHAKAMQSHDAKVDDRAFETERKRKSRARKFVPLAKAPTTGPACLRCRHWMPPVDGDEFGECRVLVRTAKDAPWANAPAGTITDRETAWKSWYVDYDYLRTGEAFQCSAYKDAKTEAA